MKLLVASDIHGSAFYCRQLLQAVERENPDKVVLLGDLLYHGPRNDLPEEYDPKAVAEMLNSIKEKILSVRGNCEAEVDQMMLEFPVLGETLVIYWEGKDIYATHGHHELPTLHEGITVLSGHTHVPKDIEEDGVRYLNPGSVSIPKENSWHGYMILEDGKYIWKELSGEVKKRA